MSSRLAPLPSLLSVPTQVQPPCSAPAAPQVISRPSTTRAAIEAALDLLQPSGLVSVLCYTGHPGAHPIGLSTPVCLHRLAPRKALCLVQVPSPKSLHGS